ncbi:NAD(P)-binding protein [Mycena sanguinolenta]|uniref:NAD(P)-binding protein n=1 Tax=Mycena sanguinolenta TaxID=230812 RepID=A0A8H7CSJ3_9AGAR|nr:NAD(P)-binding protein [Mycena sanguinolenta]
MAHPNFILNSHTLVIGGSSGMGFAVASASLANGSKLQSLYPNAHISGTAADLSCTDTLEVALQTILDAAVKETGGPLDHIVYTAGDGVNPVPLAQMTAAGAISPLTIRYIGPLLVGKLVAANPGKYLKPATSSSITLTSGIMAHKPQPFVFTLGTGGAIEVLTRSLAVALAPIRVNVIVPGAVQTELIERISARNPGAIGMIKAASLTKEIGSAEGAAEAYLFCMRSALATGQSFIIDGGHLMT